MSKLWLTVEVSPGADLNGTCADAVELAKKTGLTIWFDFNGIKCLARAGDDPRRIAADWDRVMDSKGHGNQISSDSGEVPNG